MIKNVGRYVAAAVVLGALLSGCGNPEDREAKYMKRGISLFDAGEYDKARLEFRNAGQIKPTDPEVGYRLGLVSEAQGDLRNAFISFSRAVEQDPHYAPALLKIASYYFAAEQYQQSETALNTVLADHPDNAEGHALRAALLLRRKDYDGTEKEAKIALEKDPSNITATSVLTGLYNALGDQHRAGDVLEAGIARNPKDVSLLVLKANLYSRENDLPKVVEAFNAIFKLRPGDPIFRAELAKTYVKAGKIDEAEAELRAGVAGAPSNWQMKQLLVAFLSDQRGLDPAEKEVKAYIQANPDNNDLYFWLTDLYVKHKAVDRAVNLLETIIAKQKEDSLGLNARASLAQINFARGNRDVAMKLLSVVLDKDPANQEALYIRAGIEFDLGRYESVVSDLRSILRNKANDKQALQLLSEALLREGHVDLAIDTLSQLVDADPGNPAARVRLAQLVHLSGDSNRAMTMLAAVTTANPTYAVAWESTARVATDIKNWSAAEFAIQKLAPLPGQKPTAQYLEGDVLTAQAKYEDAIAQYTDVISADPKAPIAERALVSLVNDYRHLNRLEAAAHYIETIKADTAVISTVLGECYLELGRQDAAATALDHAIAIDDGHPEPYLDRARQLLVDRKIPEAQDILKKGTAAIPSDFRIALMLAETEMSLGHTDDAINDYDDLLSRNPSMDVAANNLAELIADYKYNDPAELEKARVIADRFQASKNPLLLDTVAWVYYRLGNIPQAITLLQQAIQTPNIPAQVHYHYGVVLLKANQRDLAKQQLQLATDTTQTYPGLDDAKRLLGTL